MKKKIFDSKTEKILYRVLSESSISYTPEMIDKFVMESSNDLSSFKKIFNSHLGVVIGVTIQEILEDMEKFEGLYDKMENNSKIMSNKHTKYFNIVDMYDMFKMPQNVNKLEKITDEIDTLYYDYSKLPDVLEELIDSAKKLQEFLK
jgi:hypothetical protein